jgi:hypothetical protein
MAIASTGTAARTGIAKAGSEPALIARGQAPALTLAKPLESSGFSLFGDFGKTFTASLAIP